MTHADAEDGAGVARAEDGGGRVSRGIDVDLQVRGRTADGSPVGAHPDLDLAFTVEPGEVVVVIGPADGGRSAVIRALAGFDGAHGGRVLMRGEPWEQDGRMLAGPAERDVGVVLEDPLLLPHLTVRQNIALAIDAGEVGEIALGEAEIWVDALGLSEVGGTRASALSRGQAQRASLGRALAADPRVLLLDRPLHGLTGRTRAEMRRLLSHVLQRFHGPAVVVVDDPVDAYALADRIVVVEDGRVVQEGLTRVVTRRPATDWIASRVGLNLFRGKVQGQAFELKAHEHQLTVVTDVRGPALAAIRPRAVALFRGRPDGSPQNVWHAGVTGVDGMGGRMRVSLVGRVPLIAEVTPAAVASLELGRGGGVWVAIKATDVEVHAD